MADIAFHSIAWSFLRIGAAAFGGGMASLPIFEAELATRRHWLTPEEVTEAFALAQSTPGVIIVNFAVLTGLRLRGVAGATLGTVAVVTPAFAIILCLVVLLAGNWRQRWILAALDGLRPAVLALIAVAAFRLGQRTWKASPGWMLPALLAGVALTLGWVGPVPLILAGAALGILVGAWTRRRGKEGRK